MVLIGGRLGCLTYENHFFCAAVDLLTFQAVCTISGSLYEDQVSLAGLGPVTVTLGSIEKQTDNFDQFKEIDGVMGFTMGNKENVFASLVSAGKCDNVWSICMVDGKTSNGTLTVGGVDDRLHTGDVTYVKDAGYGFHSVDVGAVNVVGAGNRTSASIQVRWTFAARSTVAAPLDVSGTALGWQGCHSGHWHKRVAASLQGVKRSSVRHMHG